MKKVLIAGLISGLMMFNSNALAFLDVPENFWAYEKIEQMYKSGVVSGFEDGTFKPNDSITREQAATIMSNFFELTNKEEPKVFEDVVSGYWSEPYINLVSNFMPVDEKDGKYYFRPSENATRVEIAESIVKIIGYDDNETDEVVIENFKDKDIFSETDKKYISIVVQNGIMVGDDKLEFRPNDTITRAEFCALIYNIYLMRDELKAQTGERVVLTVNGEEVSYDEFGLYFKLQKKVYETMFGSSDIWSQEIEGTSLYELVKEATKAGIIENKVKVQKANELGITLDEETKIEIEDYANSGIGFEICEFYNITPEQLIKINSEGMLITKMIEYVYNTVDHSQHTHADINAPVATVKYSARHILLTTEGLSDEEKAKVKEEAQALLERVKNGEDFAALASEYSVDGGSKNNGGLYEDVTLGEFVPEFEEAALSLSNGMIYPELVETSYGYHIIKLESKKDDVRELTDDEKQEIMNADLLETIKEWINNSVIVENEAVYKAV